MGKQIPCSSVAIGTIACMPGSAICVPLVFPRLLLGILGRVYRSLSDNMTNSGIIYSIVEKSKNAVVYVGVDSKNNGSGDPNYLGSGVIIKRKIEKHGKDGFEKNVLERCKTREGLEKAERHWIQKLNTIVPNGYNIAEGGYNGNTFLGKTKEEIKEICEKKNKKLRALLKIPEVRKERIKQLKEMRENPGYGEKISLKGRGEKNSQAKITNKEAEIIISYLAKGWLSGELSKYLGISNDCIKGIKNKYTHEHLRLLFPAEYSLIERYFGCRARINPIQVMDILRTKIKNPKMTNDEIANLLGWKPRSRVNDILKKKQGYYKILSENNEEIKMLYGELRKTEC